MEADFSTQISDFFAKSEGEKQKPDKDAIRASLVRLLEGLFASSEKQQDINSVESLKAIYRRGAASFDHIHMVGVSRMELGVARVIHAIITSDIQSSALDFDLLKNDSTCKSWRLDDLQEDVFINYSVIELGLAKVKLSEAEIPEIFRDLFIDLEEVPH